MQRVFLIFAVAFIALMAGVLFYAGHLPFKAARTSATASDTAKETVAVNEAVFPEFKARADQGDEKARQWLDYFTALSQKLSVRVQ